MPFSVSANQPVGVPAPPQTASRDWRPYLLLLLPVAFTTVLVIGPLWGMLRMSLYARTSLQVYDPGTLTLQHYLSFFTSRASLRVAWATIVYAVEVTAITLVLGYPVAYFLTRTRSRWRPFLFAVTVMPFMVSLVVSAYGWLLLLGTNGPINWLLTRLPFVAGPLKLANTSTGAIIAMGFNYTSYQILPLISALSSLQPEWEEASASLGAHPAQTFVRVVWPLSLPGVISGCSMVLILTMTSFIAPRMVGGPQMPMLGVDIYNNMLIYLNWPQASAIGFVLMIATTAVYLLVALGLRSEHVERERSAR